MFVQVKEGRERKGLGMVVGMDSNKSNTSFHIWGIREKTSQKVKQNNFHNSDFSSKWDVLRVIIFTFLGTDKMNIPLS